MSNILNSKQVIRLILSEEIIIMTLLFLIIITIFPYRKEILKSGFAIKYLWIELSITLAIIILIIAITYFSLHGKGYIYNAGELKFHNLWRTTTVTKDQVKSIELIDSASLYPVLRYNGIGLKNFKLGSFRMNNGKSAQIFIFAPQQYALVIHTNDGNVYYFNDKNSIELYKKICKSE